MYVTPADFYAMRCVPLRTVVQSTGPCFRCLSLAPPCRVVHFIPSRGILHSIISRTIPRHQTITNSRPKLIPHRRFNPPVIMDPVYSRDEFIAAIRDYYDFLTKLFADPSFILEPPQDGWPNITPEACQDLGKTDQVVELLRHLPYIASRPYSNVPEGLPSGTFTDWRNIVEKLTTEDAHADNELLMSEGTEDQFGGKIPSYCIGLVQGGYLMGEDPDVILLDTKSGVVYWMNCPDKVKETASPQPSYLVYPLPGESQEANQTKEDGSDDGKSEDEDEDEDEEEEEDEDEDDDINWGPCWPVRHFFEMLKNQFRQLNFIPKDEYDVVDVWTDISSDGEPIPKGFTDLLQSIYRKHDWPEISNYHKEECLAELKQELDQKYPEHHQYYFRG
jgi:hypothetical protein